MQTANVFRPTNQTKIRSLKANPNKCWKNKVNLLSYFLHFSRNRLYEQMNMNMNSYYDR